MKILIFSLFVVCFGEVVMVVEFARHGTRAPLAGYPWTENLNVDPGSLLPSGYDEQF